MEINILIISLAFITIEDQVDLVSLNPYHFFMRSSQVSLENIMK